MQTGKGVEKYHQPSAFTHNAFSWCCAFISSSSLSTVHISLIVSVITNALSSCRTEWCSVCWIPKWWHSHILHILKAQAMVEMHPRKGRDNHSFSSGTSNIADGIGKEHIECGDIRVNSGTKVNSISTITYNTCPWREQRHQNLGQRLRIKFPAFQNVGHEDIVNSSSEWHGKLLYTQCPRW